MIIHANYGLGESAVSGQVDPDEYVIFHKALMPQLAAKKISKKQGRTVVKPSGGTVFNQEASDNQVLKDEQIIALSLLTQRIYESIGQGVQHQDIEWAFDGNNFSLTQTRPVTSLPTFTYPWLKEQPEYWSNANVKDALPMVMSNLNRKIVENLFGSIVLTPFLTAGYPLLPGIQLIKFFQGRIYLNASLMQWEYYDAFGIKPMETNAAAGGHQPEIGVPDDQGNRSVSRLRNRRKMKLGLALARFGKKAKRSFIQVRKFADRWQHEDLSKFSDLELLRAVEETMAFGSQYAPAVGLTIVALSLPIQTLTTFIDKLIPGKGQTLANALLLGRGDITSAEQGYRLVELAKVARSEPAAFKFFSDQPFDPLTWECSLPDNSVFKQTFTAFLEEFGHRAVYEGDIANPRWKEDPTYLLQVIQSMLDTADPQQIKLCQAQKRNSAWQAIRQRVPYHKQLFIRWLIDQAVKGTELREMGKSELVRLAVPARLLAKEIGARFASRGILAKTDDIFHCAWPEITAILAGHWDGQGLNILVEERIATKKEFEQLPAPDLIIGEAPQCTATKLDVAGKVFEGIGVAAGRASGQARLLLHPDEGISLQQGDVLVAPSTDPGWTPLFLKASAIIMETGGYLSHGAVVAREFGIPAVVNVPGIMQIVKEGRKIVVDGDEGNIYLVE